MKTGLPEAWTWPSVGFVLHTVNWKTHEIHMPRNIKSGFPVHINSFPVQFWKLLTDIVGKTTEVSHPSWHLPRFFPLEGWLPDFGTPFAERQSVDTDIYNFLLKSALFSLNLFPKDWHGGRGRNRQYSILQYRNTEEKIWKGAIFNKNGRNH